MRRTGISFQIFLSLIEILFMGRPELRVGETLFQVSLAMILKAHFSIYLQRYFIQFSKIELALGVFFLPVGLVRGCIHSQMIIVPFGDDCHRKIECAGCQGNGWEHHCHCTCPGHLFLSYVSNLAQLNWNHLLHRWRYFSSIVLSLLK